jgi:hypothetical protein
MTGELPPGSAAALDRRFPIDTTSEPEPFFNGMIRDSRATLDPEIVERQIYRAGFQAGLNAAIAAHGGERRFLRPVEDAVPWEMDGGDEHWYRPAPYHELTPEERQREWDTMPRTPVLEDEYGRLHGPDGRFIKRGAS